MERKRVCREKLENRKGRMDLIMETGSKEGETLVGAVIAQSRVNTNYYNIFFPSDQLELAIQRGRHTGEGMEVLRTSELTLKP